MFPAGSLNPADRRTIATHDSFLVSRVVIAPVRAMIGCAAAPARSHNENVQAQSKEMDSDRDIDLAPLTGDAGRGDTIR